MVSLMMMFISHSTPVFAGWRESREHLKEMSRWLGLTSLAMAVVTTGAFAPNPGLLRHSTCVLPRMQRGRPFALKMQAPPVEQLAEHATLLAASFAESAYTNPERYFPKFMTYPEDLVSGMKSYFNLFVPTFKARHASFASSASCVCVVMCVHARLAHQPVRLSCSVAMCIHQMQPR